MRRMIAGISLAVATVCIWVSGRMVAIARSATDLANDVMQVKEEA